MGQGCDLTKVEIKRQDDPILRQCFLENLIVGETFETLFSQVKSLMAFLAEPLNDVAAYAHVGEEAHRLLGADDLLLGEPSRVFDGLLDVLPLQVRVAV